MNFSLNDFPIPQVAVIVFGHNDRCFEFSSSNIDDILVRYTEVRPPIHLYSSSSS